MSARAEFRKRCRHCLGHFMTTDERRCYCSPTCRAKGEQREASKRKRWNEYAKRVLDLASKKHSSPNCCAAVNHAAHKLSANQEER